MSKSPSAPPASSYQTALPGPSDPPILTAYAVPPPSSSETENFISTTTHSTRRYDASDEDCGSQAVSGLLNLCWIVFGGGIPVAVLYLVGGLLFCASIIGIPCGLQVRGARSHKTLAHYTTTP